MNKFKIFFIPILMLVFLTNCDQDKFEFEVSDAQRGPTFIQSSMDVSVPVENIVVDIPIQFASLSASERVFDLEVVSISDSGQASEFSIGTAMIPANQIDGIAQISFNFSGITGVDGDSKVLVLRMANPNGAPSNEITITYFREIICNDTVLTLNTDFWASETGFNITDSSGTVVFEIAEGSLPNGVETYTFNITLADGDYTATITDSFGDGQDDGTVIGNYTLTCSIITHASGGGIIGSSESIDFTVNP